MCVRLPCKRNSPVVGPKSDVTSRTLCVVWVDTIRTWSPALKHRWLRSPLANIWLRQFCFSGHGVGEELFTIFMCRESVTPNWDTFSGVFGAPDDLSLLIRYNLPKMFLIRWECEGMPEDTHRLCKNNAAAGQRDFNECFLNLRVFNGHLFLAVKK